MGEERVYDPRFPYEEDNARLLAQAEPESTVDETEEAAVDDEPAKAPGRPGRVRN